MIGSLVLLAATATLGPPLVWFVSSGGTCPEVLSRDAMSWLQRVDGRLPGQGDVIHGACDTEATLAGLITQADPREVRVAMRHLGCHPPSSWQWWRDDSDCDVRLAHGPAVGDVWIRPDSGTVVVTLRQ